MALQNRATIKTWYETFDKPTQGQFADWIDSVPNIVDDYGSVPAYTRRFKVLVPTAQVLTLNSSPVALIPAPGAGKFLYVHNPVLVRMIYAGTPYATFINLFIYGNDTTLAAIYRNTFVLQATNDVFEMFDFDTANASRNYRENNAIWLTVDSGDPTAGNSDLTIYGTYSIFDV